MLQDRIKAYARLLVEVGINMQPGQDIYISASVDNAGFARMCADAAYDAGAHEVIMRWSDDYLSRQRYLRAGNDVFDKVAPWLPVMYDTAANSASGWLFIDDSDPELYKGVDIDRLRRAQIASGEALANFRAKEMSSYFPWCIGAVPSPAWAKKVFPDDDTDTAMDKLWDAILTVCRVRDGNDPVEEWRKHCEAVAKRVDILNNYKFKYLRYKNALGTDLTVELPENHLWAGGDEECTGRSLRFCANMPTEEIFTAPKKDGTNGVVYASKPLVVNGDIAENFCFTVEKGRIVDIRAEKGLELLKSATSLDEGSSYFGEVALVPIDSPISDSGILFYNTLFDENAACHIAFGEAYSSCVAGGADMSKEELAAAGLNASITHEDFMIGTPDLSIVGVTRSGEEIPVFTDGNFAF